MTDYGNSNIIRAGHVRLRRLWLSSLDRMSALITAAESGDRKAVERLLASGADVNEQDAVGSSALFEAVSSEHVYIVEFLLAHGADPNLPENNGTTPLMEAASGGDIEVMRVLLGAGARISAQDNFGDTALEYARAQKQDAAVEFLRSIT